MLDWIRSQRRDQYGAAVVGLLMAVGAQAAEDDTELDEVIVTANAPTSVGKLDVPLRDQPQNVSVISRETLEQFGKPRIQDVAYATVGLQPVALQLGATSYGFFMRGFNGAPIVIDGYYSSNNQFGSVGIVDMANVQSVEVLRGPASLLYGQGNPGGVVNLTTKRPLSQFAARTDVTFDDIGTRRFDADLGGPLGAGFTGRVVGVWEDSDLTTDFITHKRRLFAPQLGWSMGNVDVRAQYAYDDFRYVPDNGPSSNEDLIAHLPIGRSVQEPGLAPIRSLSESVRLESDWRFAEGWKLRAGYFWHRYRVPDGTLEIDPGATLGGTLIDRVLYGTIEPDNNGAKDWMLTGQLLGEFKTGAVQHNLTAAVDYIDNRSRYDYAAYGYSPIDYANPVYQTGPVVPDPANFLYSGEGAFKSTIKAAYAQDLVSIGERWKVLLGVRSEKIETTGYADAAANTVASVSSESKVTPRAGVVFEYNPLLSFFASYSEAFAPQYGEDFFGNRFAPEQSRSYEAGVRRQFDSRLLLTAAVFDIRKANILVVDPDPLHSGFNVTAGVARSRGFEMELHGRVTDAWRLGGGIAWTDAEIEKSTDPVSFPEGDTLPAAAKWSALLNTQYRVRGGALDGLELGANVSYTSSRPYVLPNTSELSAYVRTDLFAAWEISPAFSVQLNLNNVTDERIVLANGYGRAQFDTPRSVGLVVRYHAGAARGGK